MISLIINGSHPVFGNLFHQLMTRLTISRKEIRAARPKSTSCYSTGGQFCRTCLILIGNQQIAPASLSADTLYDAYHVDLEFRFAFLRRSKLPPTCRIQIRVDFLIRSC